MCHQLACRSEATPEECRVVSGKRLEVGGRGRAVDRLGYSRNGVWVAANGAALSNPARIEADHVVVACKIVDVLQSTELPKHSADAHAWSARDEQKHAFLPSVVGRRHAAEPKRELRSVGTGGIERHLESCTLYIRHVAASRPA
jgi:hypothetical protein